MFCWQKWYPFPSKAVKTKKIKTHVFFYEFMSILLTSGLTLLKEKTVEREQKMRKGKVTCHGHSGQEQGCLGKLLVKGGMEDGESLKYRVGHAYLSVQGL